MTSDGRRHLGGIFGTNEKKNKYIDKKFRNGTKKRKFYKLLQHHSLTQPSLDLYFV